MIKMLLLNIGEVERTDSFELKMYTLIKKFGEVISQYIKKH